MPGLLAQRKVLEYGSTRAPPMSSSLHGQTDKRKIPTVFASELHGTLQLAFLCGYDCYEGPGSLLDQCYI